jgi:aspartate aminotransferase-like enzyme
MHDVSRRHSEFADMPTAIDPAQLRPGDVIQAVHVETEFGTIVPIDGLLREVRKAGGFAIMDLACSTPVDPFDLTHCDVAVLGSHKCLGGAPGLGILVVSPDGVNRIQASRTSGWSLPAYTEDALVKHRFIRGEFDRPSGRPPLVTYPIHVVNALRYALRDRQTSGTSPNSHESAAAKLRAALNELGFSNPEGRLSNAVLRFEVPLGVDAERLRADLLAQGFFVIGGIGASGKGVIRVGCMSLPQIDYDNISRLVAAVNIALSHQNAVAAPQ